MNVYLKIKLSVNTECMNINVDRKCVNVNSKNVKVEYFFRWFR